MIENKSTPKAINFDLYFTKASALGKAKTKESKVALQARKKLKKVVLINAKISSLAKPIEKIYTKGKENKTA